MKASVVVKQHTHKSWTKKLEFRRQFVPAVDTFSLDMVGNALNLISVPSNTKCNSTLVSQPNNIKLARGES